MEEKSADPKNGETLSTKELKVAGVQDAQCRTLGKVDVGVQHDGFFETSFDLEPAEEEPERKALVEDESSQTSVLQTCDWSGQVETGSVDFGVQAEISRSTTSEIQCQTEFWQRSPSSEEVDVDALLEEEERQEKEQRMLSLVNLLEERVKDLESVLEKERRIKLSSRTRMVEEWDKELRAVKLALQIALEESHLAHLDLEAAKEDKCSMEEGFLVERKLLEEQMEEMMEEAERRRQELEIELEEAVKESSGLREQVGRMEARIEELEAEVR